MVAREETSVIRDLLVLIGDLCNKRLVSIT